MQTVAAEKSGTFTCGWKVTEEKCGLNADLPNAHTFTYKVHVRADRLDKFGFVVDNRDITRYFKDTYTNDKGSYVSCERMALAAIEYIRRLIDRDGQGRFCTYCRVEISGFPEANVVAVFVA